MTGQKGRSGIGSGGAGRGQGSKRKHITIERGMTLSLSRVSHAGDVYPAVEAEVARVGGDTGHDLQFVLVTPDETMTLFVNSATSRPPGETIDLTRKRVYNKRNPRQ